MISRPGLSYAGDLRRTQEAVHILKLQTGEYIPPENYLDTLQISLHRKVPLQSGLIVGAALCLTLIEYKKRGVSSSLIKQYQQETLLKLDDFERELFVQCLTEEFADLPTFSRKSSTDLQSSYLTNSPPKSGPSPRQIRTQTACLALQSTTHPTPYPIPRTMQPKARASIQAADTRVNCRLFAQPLDLNDSELLRHLLAFTIREYAQSALPDYILGEFIDYPTLESDQILIDAYKTSVQQIHRESFHYLLIIRANDGSDVAKRWLSQSSKKQLEDTLTRYELACLENKLDTARLDTWKIALHAQFCQNASTSRKYIDQQFTQLCTINSELSPKSQSLPPQETEVSTQAMDSVTRQEFCFYAQTSLLRTGHQAQCPLSGLFGLYDIQLPIIDNCAFSPAIRSELPELPTTQSPLQLLFYQTQARVYLRTNRISEAALTRWFSIESDPCIRSEILKEFQERQLSPELGPHYSEALYRTACESLSASFTSIYLSDFSSFIASPSTRHSLRFSKHSGSRAVQFHSLPAFILPLEPGLGVYLPKTSEN